VSFLSITIPASLLLAAVLLALVVRAVREGAFDDWEGPAARHGRDDDECPEREGALDPGGDGSGPQAGSTASSSSRAARIPSTTGSRSGTTSQSETIPKHSQPS
jgi:cbb3-type cytochrome oxidase maturation protein